MCFLSTSQTYYEKCYENPNSTKSQNWQVCEKLSHIYIHISAFYPNNATDFKNAHKSKKIFFYRK